MIPLNSDILGRTYRHVTRYRQVLAILIRYGFGDMVRQLKLQKYADLLEKIKFVGAKEKRLDKLPRWQLLRMALEELGPTFVKFGQLLSTHQKLLPDEYNHELVKLQDSVQPFTFAEAREIIEQEFERPLEELFADFPETPIASASIAQVYRATLQTGEVVAVKVQRPGIETVIKTDMEIIANLAAIYEKRGPESHASYNLPRVVKEFSDNIEQELDFRTEVENIRRFSRCFAGNKKIKVPRVYELYTRRVLVMEFIEGIEFSDFEALKAGGVPLEKVAADGAELIFQQIFEHGYFHGDPHPGNLILCPDGRICFLDCGAMGAIPNYLRDQLARVLVAFSSNDSKRLVRAILPLTECAEIINRNQFRHALAMLMEEYRDCPLRDVRMDRFIERFTALMRQFKLELMPPLYLLLKSLVTLEGLCARLAPDFKVEEAITPHVKRMIRERLSIKQLGKGAFYALDDLAGLLRELPNDVHDMMRQVMQGRAKIEFEHQGLEPMLRSNELISTHLVFAIVLGSLIIGSSVVLLAHIPPTWHGISLLGLAGFLFSAIMGFGLLVSIIRNR